MIRTAISLQEFHTSVQLIISALRLNLIERYTSTKFSYSSRKSKSLADGDYIEKTLILLLVFIMSNDNICENNQNISINLLKLKTHQNLMRIYRQKVSILTTRQNSKADVIRTEVCFADFPCPLTLLFIIFFPQPLLLFSLKFNVC